jgi:hypothetical protein
MLQRDLKKIANESIFNPNKPDKLMQIVLDVGNPDYWVTKAIEYLRCAQSETGEEWHDSLRYAITLLILARAEREKNA